MNSKSYNHLLAFMIVARERNFTKAAALLGVSQSALSQTVRALERLLRHADRRRQQGLLTVLTLSEIARQLVRPRAAATAR